MSSTAALVGLIPHYLFHYLAGTPIWTDQVAEWIMARTPSRYSVMILDSLGGWAKPWASTGGLALLGLSLLLARLAGRLVAPNWRGAVTAVLGSVFALFLAWNTGYSSWFGSIAFWLPALSIAAFVPRAAPERPIFRERRAFLSNAGRLTVPLVMSSGVLAVAAESYFRDEALSRRARQPIDLFPFQPLLDRQGFGKGLVRSGVTPTPEFYGMSKNAVDPAIDPEAWRLILSVNGRPIRFFRYGELLAMQKQLRYVTLRCISNTLKSDLMGTAEWVGVHLSDLVNRRSLPQNIKEVAFIGVDGHDDSLNIDYAFGEDSFIALGMNGKTLSRTHGFPVRLLAPNYYGCRNVKWIREIRFVTRPYYGTWQRLGYSKEPLIHTCSHIDHQRRDGRYLQFGGVSFAGTRGIRQVRVRADRGPWQPVRLEPAISNYTWTRWIGQLAVAPGTTIEANAQDGTGAWQELAESGPFPGGVAGPTIVIGSA